MENILGAGYTQDDGYFDGTMISNTYAKKMQKNGATVKTGVKVTEVEVSNKKITGLKTDDGETHSFDYVVDCTGPWSKFTGEMVGIDVPAASRDLAKLIMRGESTPLLEDWAFERLLK